MVSWDFIYFMGWIPSSNLLYNYGKSRSLMGKNTIKTINDYFTGWKPMSQQNDPKPMAALLTGWKPMCQDGMIQMDPR